MIGKEEDLIVLYVTGQGRNPCVNDLTTILLVTDGTELTSPVCHFPCTNSMLNGKILMFVRITIIVFLVLSFYFDMKVLCAA